MSFNADLHIHSKYSTKDSKTKPEKILRVCEKRGIDCIAISDHNTIKGSIATKKLAKKIAPNIKVILASEIKTDLGDVIGYHITEEIKPDKFEKVIDKIKEQGGYVCVAHPTDNLRGCVGLGNIKPVLNKIDFLELNARSFWYMNKKTVAFSKRHKIPLLASSDAHMPREIGSFSTVLGDVNKLKVNKVKINVSNLHPFYPLGRTKLYKIFGI